MAISTEEVDKIAKLSRLSFPSDEKQKISQELSGILDYVGQLGEIGELAADSAGDGIYMNLMRDDVAEPAEDTDVFLKQAPSREGDFIKVKSVMQ